MCQVGCKPHLTGCDSSIGLRGSNGVEGLPRFIGHSEFPLTNIPMCAAVPFIYILCTVELRKCLSLFFYIVYHSLYVLDYIGLDYRQNEMPV